MTNHSASRRMPTPKQMEKLEVNALRKQASRPAGAQSANMPPEYWESVLNDPSAGARPSGGVPVQQRRLSACSAFRFRRCSGTMTKPNNSDCRYSDDR